MLINERAKNCEKFELEPIFNISKNLKKPAQQIVLNSLIKRADELECFEFICDKMNEYVKNIKFISKSDNEIIKVFLYANIRNENFKKNIEIYENYKIEYDFFLKNKLLNIFSYSYIELGLYGKSIEILEKIKNEDLNYFENYIDVLIKDEQYEKSENILKSYFPKKDKHRIWKSMNLANLFYEKNDLENLQLHAEKALKDFLKYRITKDEVEHAACYYYLGLFFEKLGDLKKSKIFFKHSAEYTSELLIELKYKDLAKLKLKEMEEL